jgi:arylformamidase
MKVLPGDRHGPGARFVSEGSRMAIFDISVPISPHTPVWPGDPAMRLVRTADMDRGDPMNLSELQMSAHVGTHMDAPRHFVRDGATVDRVPLERLVGPAMVIEVEGDGPVTARDLRRVGVPPDTTRLLIKTRNSRLWRSGKAEFDPAFVALDPSAARWAVACGIQVLGIDYLSVDPADGPGDYAAHRTLLEGGVIILESLDLSAVAPGRYTLVALPLKVVDGDGAPVRAILLTE